MHTAYLQMHTAYLQMHTAYLLMHTAYLLMHSAIWLLDIAFIMTAAFDIIANEYRKLFFTNRFYHIDTWTTIVLGTNKKMTF